MRIALALNFQIPKLDTDEPPKWLLLVPSGSFTGRDGRQWHNPNPQQVIDETRRVGLDLPVDIEHATEIKGSQGEFAGAVAWLPITALEIRDGAIWGRIEWNEHGSHYVTGRQYRYYSPAFHHDRTGKVIRLASVGLTNRSNLPELPALNRQTEEPTMDKILAALGLKADASEDDAVTAISTLKSDHQLALNRAQAPDPAKFIPVETHKLALNRAETAEQQLADNAKEALEADATALVDEAIEGGKIAPANRDHYLALCRQDGGMAQVKELLAVAPKVMEEQKPKDERPRHSDSKLTDVELATCRQLGISEDEYLSVRNEDS